MSILSMNEARKMVIVTLGAVAVACGGSAQPAPATPASAPPAVEATAAAAPASAPSSDSEEAKAAETIDRITTRKFSAARSYFDAKMTEALPVTKISNVWDSIEAQFGAYQGKTLLGTEGEAGGQRTIRYDLAFANGHMTAQVMFDHRQIAGLFFRPRS